VYSHLIFVYNLVLIFFIVILFYCYFDWFFSSILSLSFDFT
jgi:hypothetical protein